MSKSIGVNAVYSQKIGDNVAKLYIDGNNFPKIAEMTGIPYATLLSWKNRNTGGFGDRMQALKVARFSEKVERKLSEHIDSEDARISLDATKFVAERLPDWQKGDGSTVPTSTTINNIIMLPQRENSANVSTIIDIEK